jgi:protocatechuate 3,4-dioxygenase, alpha subunit
MTLGTTPSQTVGPFFSIGLPWHDGPHAAPAGTPGLIRVGGRILDGDGAPVPDGMVETWQSDPPAVGGFRGLARCETDEQGRWAVFTLKPGRVPGPGGAPQAPHLAVSIFARGLLIRLVTRIYFADEAQANAADPVLASLPDDAARATLLADPRDGGYELDVHLQGKRETVFFDL